MFSKALEEIRWWLGPFPHTVPLPAVDQGNEPLPSTADMIHLACAADENYIPHCAAMLSSLARHTGGAGLTVHFLHPPELSEESLSRLGDFVTAIGFHFEPGEVNDSRIEKLFATPEISRVAWFRTLLPELKPDLEKILYLDCDTLVVDSIKELWETDIENHLAAAVRNVIEQKLTKRHVALGIPDEQPYFNSGVLLMNLALMRRERSSEQILEHAEEHGSRLIWVDQDSLNLVLGKKCKLLHPRWNCQNSLFYWKSATGIFGASVVNEATSNPAILHFEGPGLAKPWNALCKHPYRNHYHFYLQKSPWKDHSRIVLDWKNRLLRLLPMRVAPVILALLWRLKRKFSD